MYTKKYRICVTEDTLPLIAFLNDGITPPYIPEESRPWFLFEINSEREITVGRDSIKREDDLYDDHGTTKVKYMDYHTLIG